MIDPVEADRLRPVSQTGNDSPQPVDPFEDDTPIEGCSLENPEVCESCQ